MHTDTPPILIFVYSVDGGALNTLLQVAHKVLRPETYPCSLCALTYGALTPKPAWTAFLKRLSFPTRFLHRDEFYAEFQGVTQELPTILLAQDGALTPVVTAKELEACQDVQTLIDLLRSRL